MRSLLMLMASWFAEPDMVGPVAVQAAYTLNTMAEPKPERCNQCDAGKITHGDGHVTDCPCGEGCDCHAVTHPPTILLGPEQSKPKR